MATTYTIVISSSAFKQLEKIQKGDADKIKKLVDSLATNPRPLGVKKLKGVREDLYRVRLEITELFIRLMIQ